MPAIYQFFIANDHYAIVQRLIDLLAYLGSWIFLSRDTVFSLIAILIPCLVIFLLVQAVAGISTYIERKLAADIQRRVGPNKCNVGVFLGDFARAAVSNASSPNAGAPAKLMGALLKPAVPLLESLDKLKIPFTNILLVPPGLLIFLADGIKLIMKEDIIPDAVDKPMFKLAPTIVLVSAFGACAALPYSDAWYVADFNTGVLYIAAITSMEVLGILMAGWASNNKWALLGGMRSAAQIVSYELPVGLALTTGAMIAGTLSLQGMCFDQFGFHKDGSMWNQGWLWQWNLFHPAMFVLAPVYFLAALAECNRTPFDIPEAESELVAGYHTEYTGMRFAFFFMAEYAMMCVTSALAVTIFLGGWSSGIGLLENASWWMATPPEMVNGIMSKAPTFYWYATLFHLAVFGAKTYLLVLIMMWIRWTLPRFRVDQMMTLCWKKLIPLGMVCFFGVAVWMVARIPIANRLGEETLTNITFFLRLFFALVVVGGVGWFFMKPLSPEQKAQREMLAKGMMGTAM